MNRPFHKGMSAYRDVEIQTRTANRDQHDLVALMFEGVLESVARATGAIQQQDMALKVDEIGRAIRIVHEGLRTSLDMENGGELATNLANLYEYCVLRLTQANANNDTQALAEVAGLLRPVADAWKQMREQPPGGAVVAVAAPAQSAGVPSGASGASAPTPPNKAAYSAASAYGGGRSQGSLLMA